MKPPIRLDVLVLTVMMFLAISHAWAIEVIPERQLVERGGVLYPQVGDAMQELFTTPPNIKDLIQPGALIGVLPSDCVSVSSGAIGDYYRCNYDLNLKPEEFEGNIVYRVIDVP